MANPMLGRNLGPLGERVAEQELRALGFDILGKNVRLKCVEFDLIARRGVETWFVEVKTRSSVRGGFPYEHVGASKIERMEAGALEFLESRGEGDLDFAFWAASIVVAAPDRPPVVEWIPLE